MAYICVKHHFMKGALTTFPFFLCSIVPYSFSMIGEKRVLRKKSNKYDVKI